MFKRIATGDSGRPVVLSEFNEAEHASMELILCLAKENLANRRMNTTARILAEMMIDQQAKAYEIEVP